PSAGLHNRSMRIDQILAGDGPIFSFEFFPPKTEAGERNLYAALDELRKLEPSFVSVTYGAGGSTREKTIEIVKRIKEEHGQSAPPSSPRRTSSRSARRPICASCWRRSVRGSISSSHSCSSTTPCTSTSWAARGRSVWRYRSSPA